MPEKISTLSVAPVERAPLVKLCPECRGYANHDPGDAWCVAWFPKSRYPESEKH